MWTSLEEMRRFRAAKTANNTPRPAGCRPPRRAKGQGRVASVTMQFEIPELVALSCVKHRQKA
jgi:hypothetical protein